MIKLNVGCGNRKIHGFTNIDLRPEVQPDVIMDIRKLNEKFKDVDLIYACHVLEHFPRKPVRDADATYKEVLNNWFDALKEGGTLRMAVPDFQAVCEYYVSTKDFNSLNWQSALYGGQKHGFDIHYNIWDWSALKRDLLDVGFRDVRKYDWRKTEHSFIDDYSQAYLPHMDKVNGKLMSLNVEATK